MNRTLTSKQELQENLAEIGTLDSRIAEIEAKYETMLRSATESIAADKADELGPLKAKLNSLWDESEAYVSANRKELMPDGKTLTLDTGTVFYRSTPGAVALKSKKKNAVAQALEWLKKKFPRYVRNKPEIDKEAILADYHQDPSVIIKLGEFFRIHVVERFYMRPQTLKHLLVRTEGGAISREAIGGDTKKKRKAA